MKEELTMLEIQELKQRAESAILAIINQLQDDTGLPISVDFDMTKVTIRSGYSFINPEVHIKIEL